MLKRFTATVVQRIKSPTTLVDNLIAIYGLPFSILCLLSAIDHKITVDNIQGGFYTFFVIGIMSYFFMDYERLKEKHLAKGWYAMPIVASLFCGLCYVGMIHLFGAGE